MKNSLGMAVIILCSAFSMPLSAGSTSEGSKGGKYGPARFEEIPGSNVKRVILDEKSVQRLGIEVGEISKQNVFSKQYFGGSVVMPVSYQETNAAKKTGAFGGFGAAAPSVAHYRSLSQPDPDFIWLQVTLSKPEWQRINDQYEVRVIPLDTREDIVAETTAQPSGLPPATDPKRSMLRVYYKIAKDSAVGYQLHDRVRVEITMKDDGHSHKVVPYDAVHYDSKGKSWVYSNPEQFVYERKSVDIQRIEGNLAVLNSGPEFGTSVVIVGAALLYGAEVVFKK